MQTFWCVLQDNGDDSEDEVDLYERLGLQPEATDREIKTAYRSFGIT